MRLAVLTCTVIGLLAPSVMAGNYTVALTPDQEVALKLMESHPKDGKAAPVTVQMLVDRALSRATAQVQAKKKAEARAAVCTRLKGSSYQTDKDAAAALCD